MENAFKWRHYEGTIILLCVRWYLRYALSYRDLEEMMSERGSSVVHTTIFRWVQRFAPELEKRMRPHLKKSNDSWRVDETYVKVRGKWMYLYRALDSKGQTLDFLLNVISVLTMEILLKLSWLMIRGFQSLIQEKLASYLNLKR